MQQDPTYLQAGPNTYEYVNDDPTNEVDPTGLEGLTWNYFWKTMLNWDTPLFLVGLKRDGVGGVESLKPGVHEEWAKDTARDIMIAMPQTRAGALIGGGYSLIHQGAGNVEDMRKGKSLRGINGSELRDTMLIGGVFGRAAALDRNFAYSLMFVGIGNGFVEIADGHVEQGVVDLGGAAMGSRLLKGKKSPKVEVSPDGRTVKVSPDAWTPPTEEEIAAAALRLRLQLQAQRELPQSRVPTEGDADFVGPPRFPALVPGSGRIPLPLVEPPGSGRIPLPLVEPPSSVEDPNVAFKVRLARKKVAAAAAKLAAEADDPLAGLTPAQREQLAKGSQAKQQAAQASREAAKAQKLLAEIENTPLEPPARANGPVPQPPQPQPPQPKPATPSQPIPKPPPATPSAPMSKLTADEAAAIENMKAKNPSSYVEGEAGYTDSLGFPVRHPNVAQEHLAKQAEVANDIIKANGLTDDSTVVLYNKPLKPANNPFATGNTAMKPDVQVFRKTPNGWERVGKPIEIEPKGRGFGHKEELYKDNNGGSFEPIEY